MSFFHYLFIALEVVLVFNLLIAVHEWGHFLAARWRGLKVERFAIWFGKPIWKKKVGDVEYALGWIPAGGYVSLPQMATMEAIEGKTDEKAAQLPSISPLDKIIVAFAGPLFSFLLALVFAVLVWQVGKPVNDSDNSTVIGWVANVTDDGRPGPAWQAGLRPGDKILTIDGHPVSSFQPTTNMLESVVWRIITSTGTNIEVKFLRDGKEQIVSATPIHPPTKWYERKSLRKLIMSGASPAIIGEVATNSPAAVAGLKQGDEIVKMDGQPLYHWLAVMDAQIAMSNGVIHPLTFTVKRGQEEFEKTLLAVKPILPTNAIPNLGITAWMGDTNITLSHPSPWEQIEVSAGQIFHTLGALFERNGEVGVQQLGGAVMIGRVYYNLLQDDDGWRRVLWFSVILNVNLALLNLLPLPVLDGGHITLALIEWIRRRPVSGKILEKIQSGFAMLLIGFMIYIAFFDTGDWIRSARADREVPVVFAPPVE